jgi:hypothetical protein
MTIDPEGYDLIEKKLDTLPDEDPVRDILEWMLERLKELEERVAAPPVKPAKRP